MQKLNTLFLAEQMHGKLIGDNIPINGIFNILKDSKKGDVVIRHRIDQAGVDIASVREVSCLITQNPTKEAIETCKELDLPLIICDKIELANAFAIRWAVENFARDALRIVVTGTNGKSTTTHMIYKILKFAGYQTYTNTDSKSEFNTLIDPMVAKQIAEFSGKIEAMVVEVSEVQGWMDRIMENHAHMMTSSLNPQILVFTNVSLDHVELVNSIEDAYKEISGTVKGFHGDYAILNADDPLIKKMGKLMPPQVKSIFYGTGSIIENRDKGICYNGNILLPKDELPFKSPHFIQNTMASISTAITLNINFNIIRKAVKSYQPLKRRFSIISHSPLIIDDYAHNPDGIRATITSSAKLAKGKLYLVTAIRGSRGEIINKVNAQAISNVLKGVNHLIIITSSADVVDQANLVRPSEKKIFIQTIEEEGLNYKYIKNIYDSLEYIIKISSSDDTILLIGAQGMDPAQDVLNKIKNENKNIMMK